MPHGLSAVRKVARCAKTQPMRFRLPLLRRPGSDPTILAPASSAPVPTPRNWPFRRSSRGLEARPTAASNETTWAVVPRSVPASMRGVLGLPATPAFMPRVRRLDRFSAQRTPSCARRALSPLCWCIFQAAIQYAAATRAVDAGQASWRNVGVSADNDCPGSRQSGRTIPPRHQAVTRRVFSNPLAAQGPDAACAACHYPLSAKLEQSSSGVVTGMLQPRQSSCPMRCRSLRSSTDAFTSEEARLPAQEARSGVVQRVHRTPMEWLEIMARFRAGGQSKTKFCERYAERDHAQHVHPVGAAPGVGRRRQHAGRDRGVVRRDRGRRRRGAAATRLGAVRGGERRGRAGYRPGEGEWELEVGPVTTGRIVMRVQEGWRC